jgi:hypothetical protein
MGADKTGTADDEDFGILQSHKSLQAWGRFASCKRNLRTIGVRSRPSV